MIAAGIYDLLNRAVGKPSIVSPEVYTRSGEIFTQHTLPLLDEAGAYIQPDSKILIVGCGSGVEIEWFSSRCDTVFAVDIDPQILDNAKSVATKLSNVRCILTDGRTLPFDGDYFDLIFMHDVCEHIIHIEENFAEFHRVLKPNKILYNSFAPLFYSPYGAHLQDALKIPWGHLIFGLRAVVDVRNRYYPGELSASNWDEVGLNRITERRYNKVVMKSGFRRLDYDIKISKNIPIVNMIPVVRNLFILGIRDILRK